MHVIEKFRPYLLHPKVMVYTNHYAPKPFPDKKDAKSHLMRWVLLVQEFNIEIKYGVGAQNVVADHLFKLMVKMEDLPIDDVFPDEHLLAITLGVAPLFDDIAYYLVCKVLPPNFTNQRKKFFHDIKSYL